jgi:eukaryotic-like serine/threonine-protein kinase
VAAAARVVARALTYDARMTECLAEDELFELAHGKRSLSEAPALEAHLADCAACSAVLSTLLDGADERRTRRDRSGTTLGPYRLDSLIGAGAMGEVYRGWDARLERDIAIKVLSPEFGESADRVRRLAIEARAAAAITHPNVVTVYDTGESDGIPYVISELITGETLRSVIDRGSVPRTRALELTLQLARGLSAAHAQGVVHRDLKPTNLLVTGDGTLKILDFGLAKVVGDRGADATEPGTLLGTSGYLAPEQARGETADARSDLFAVGAIAYELLSGQRAFGGATFAERLSAVLRDTPPVLDDPANAIVMRCLDKDPRKRFQSANDLAWVLEPLLGESPTNARPERRGISRRMFAIGAAATGVGGLVLGRALRPSAPRAFVPEYRQLTFRQGRVASARFTRDGGSLLYSALWEDHPLAIFTARLGGGGTRPLDLPPAQLLAVSSRGELALSLDHRAIDGFHFRGQLALAPIEGGTPRGLGVDVQDADFTPDGSEIAIVRSVGRRRFTLELPIGNVLAEAGWISHPRVSPDGSAIACCLHLDPFDDRGDLVIIARTGGPPRTVAADWSSIDGLSWAAHGRALWISASREGGNNSVRAIALDGRELAHIPAAGRLRMFDMTADGRAAVTHCSGRMRMMVRAPGATDEVDLALSDVSMVCDISGDGRRIAFVEFGDVDTASGAYVRPTDGGPALRLGEFMPLDLADDGHGVLVGIYGDPPVIGIAPIPEGQVQRVPIALARIGQARWCNNGRLLVTGATIAGERFRIWRRDPDGRLLPLTEPGVVAPPFVNPRGDAFAIFAGDRLIVADIDARTPPRAIGGYPDREVCGWSADSTAVYIRGKSPPVIQIHRIELASGISTLLREITPPRLGVRAVDRLFVSQAGDAYAYSYGQELSRLYTMTTDDPA